MPYDKQTKSRKLYIYLNVLVISKTKKNIYWVSKRIIVRILKFLLLLVINKFLIFIFACLRSTCVAKALREWEKDSLTTLCRIILYLHTMYICIRNILNVWVRWIHVYSHFPIFLYSSYFNIDTIKCLHYVPRISRLWCFLDFMNLDRTDKILTFVYIKLNNWIQRY